MHRLGALGCLFGLWGLACAAQPSGDGESSGGTHGDAGPHSGGGSGGSGASWPSGGNAGTIADGSFGGGSGGGPAGGTGGAAGSTGGNGGAAGAAGGTGGTPCGTTGTIQCKTSCPTQFPQGVPESDFIANACTYQDTDPAVDKAVNDVMASLSGCGIGSDCPITTVPGTSIDEICQNWFAAVTAQLRAQGFCAGQHIVGGTDEIAVTNSCCEGKWYGYHVCYYGGPKVVWNPGARRGWWMITPSYCSP